MLKKLKTKELTEKEQARLNGGYIVIIIDSQEVCDNYCNGVCGAAINSLSCIKCGQSAYRV